MVNFNIKSISSMPLTHPSYPQGPYRFINREYFIIKFKTDPLMIEKALPYPLEPDGSNTVSYEFIHMPEATGFGSYTESGLTIPARFQGEDVSFAAHMYLDNEPALLAGREIWGFPKKLGHPKLELVDNTLTGTLDYAGQTVAVGTMGYNYPGSSLASDSSHPLASILSKTQVNLKIIPDALGGIAICQLIAYNLTNIQIKQAWSGEARISLTPHINAPIGDFPVLEVIEGVHILSDLTLPYGRVVHDYLKEV